CRRRIHPAAGRESPDRFSGFRVQAMNQLVTASNDEPVGGFGWRRIERKLAFRASLPPKGRTLYQVGGHEVVIKCGLVRELALYRGRRASTAAGLELQYFLSVREADAAKDLIASGQVNNALGNHRRRVNIVASRELPQQLTVARSEAIEIPIVRTDQNAIA